MGYAQLPRAQGAQGGGGVVHLKARWNCFDCSPFTCLAWGTLPRDQVHFVRVDLFVGSFDLRRGASDGTRRCPSSHFVFFPPRAHSTERRQGSDCPDTLKRKSTPDPREQVFSFSYLPFPHRASFRARHLLPPRESFELVSYLTGSSPTEIRESVFIG